MILQHIEKTCIYSCFANLFQFNKISNIPGRYFLPFQYPSTPGITNEETEGFYVYIRNFDSDDDRDYVRTPIIGDYVRSYLIEKLEPEESYDIKVESFNSAGESKGSNVIIRSTLGMSDSLFVLKRFFFFLNLFPHVGSNTLST